MFSLPKKRKLKGIKIYSDLNAGYNNFLIETGIACYRINYLNAV